MHYDNCSDHIVLRTRYDSAVSLALHKHDLSYKARWTRDKTADPLRRGTLWHLVMETHYKLLLLCQRENRIATASELRRAQNEHLYDVGMRQTEDQQLIEWMYIGYLEAYGFDPQWEIVAVEHSAEVWLPTDRGGRSNFKLKVKIDLIVREQGRIWLVDHKSCKDLPYRKDLDMDDQFGLYTWAMRQLGKRVYGSVHSAARTHRPKWGGPDDLRPRNEKGQYLNADGVTVSKNQPTEYPLDKRFSRTPLVRDNTELDTIAVDAYKTARVSRSFAPGDAPRSPDPDRCGWRCDFTEACLMGRKGVDEVEILLSTGYHQGLDADGKPIRH